jgi:hypothetical protein
MAGTFENPVRNHYLHAPEHVEEHKADLTDQAKNPPIPREPYGEKVVSMLRVAEREEPRKRRSVVYERQRSQYDSQYIKANADRLTKRFLDALQNPEDSLNPAAQQGLHVLAESMGKTEGVSLSQLARERDVSQPALSRLVRDQLIPILYRDKHTVYLANETAEFVADLNEKAKKEGKPLARVVREARDTDTPQPRR